MEKNVAVSSVAFKKSKKTGGYNKAEVDGFLQILNVNYKKMQDEYAELVEKYKRQSVDLNEAVSSSSNQRQYYESQIKELQTHLESAKKEKTDMRSVDNLLGEQYRLQSQELKKTQSDLENQRIYYDAQIVELKSQLEASKSEASVRLDFDSIFGSQYKKLSAELEKERKDALTQQNYYKSYIAKLETQIGELKRKTEEMPDPQVISKVLIDAEMLAKKITGDAQSEAAQIKNVASNKIGRIEEELMKIKEIIASL